MESTTTSEAARLLARFQQRSAPTTTMFPAQNSRNNELIQTTDSRHDLEELFRSDGGNVEIMREMIRDPTDGDAHLDVLESNKIWTQLSMPTDPADPLKLGQKWQKHVREGDPMLGRLERLEAQFAELRTEAEWRDHVREYVKAITEYISVQRWTDETDLWWKLPFKFNPATNEYICHAIMKDFEDGWKFPGGSGKEIPKHESWRYVLRQFQCTILGFRRDVLDNRHAYHGAYPPACFIGERLGEEEEINVDIGGQKFAWADKGDWSKMPRGGEYTYVKADEVDWEEVAANGGLGHIIILE